MKRILNIATTICCIAIMLTACRKECALDEKEGFSIANQDKDQKKKDNKCYYVLNDVTISVKSLQEIAGLEQAIKKLRIEQSGTYNNVQYEAVELKNVGIVFDWQIPVGVNQFDQMRGFNQLPITFSGITVSLTQNYPVVPFVDRTPMTCEIYQSWTSNYSPKMMLGANSENNARWGMLTEDNNCIKDISGRDPNSAEPITYSRDTVTRTIESISWYLENKSAINLEINDAKGGINNKFVIIKFANDIAITDDQKATAAEIIKYGTDKVQYPDSLVRFEVQYAIIPAAGNIIQMPVSFWKQDLNRYPLSANVNAKFVVSCKDTAEFRKNDQNTSVFEVDQTPCEDDVVIAINSLSDLSNAKTNIENALQNPLNRVAVQFGNFALVNGTWESHMSAVMSYINNGSVSNMQGGQVSWGSDSVAVNYIKTVKDMHDRGILKANNYGGITAGNGFPYKMNPGANEIDSIAAIPTIFRANKVTVSDLAYNFGALGQVIPSEVYADVNCTIPMDIIFQNLIDNNWNHNITMTKASGVEYTLQHLTNPILDCMQIPAAGAVSGVTFTIVFPSTPIAGPYLQNRTYNYTGSHITKADFGGGDESGTKLLALWLKSGGTGYLQSRNGGTTVNATLYTTNPANVEDSTGRIYVTMNTLSELAGASGGEHFQFNNMTVCLSGQQLMDYGRVVIIQGQSPSVFFANYNFTIGNNVSVIDASMLDSGKSCVVYTPSTSVAKSVNNSSKTFSSKTVQKNIQLLKQIK